MNNEDKTREILNRIRKINESNSEIKAIQKGILAEAEDKQKLKQELDAIAITNDPKFGTNALQNQIDQYGHQK